MSHIFLLRGQHKLRTRPQENFFQLPVTSGLLDINIFPNCLLLNALNLCSLQD
jgi:hypothetical protein